MATKKKSVKKKTAKSTKKKSSKKKTTRKKSSSSASKSDEKMQKALIENFISLQKVMVNLSEKFDGLNTQISKLLELFELSAKTLAEKEFVSEKEKKDSREVIEKMDDIMEQNRTLARGMTLMHDRISEQEEIPFTQPNPQPHQPRPQPRQMPQQNPRQMPQKNSMPGTKPLTKSLPELPSMKSNPPTREQPSSEDSSEFSSSTRSIDSSSGQRPNQGGDSYQKSISSHNNESDTKQRP